MLDLKPKAYLTSAPDFPLAPLIDIVFITLIFYMTLSVYYQLETELSISVPKAEHSQESERSPGEIIINVDQSGKITINQRLLTAVELRKMLEKLSGIYSNQPVIIRADKKTRHENVVRVLDACAAANIWNIAFSTRKEQP